MNRRDFFAKASLTVAGIAATCGLLPEVAKAQTALNTTANVDPKTVLFQDQHERTWSLVTWEKRFSVSELTLDYPSTIERQRQVHRQWKLQAERALRDHPDGRRGW